MTGPEPAGRGLSRRQIQIAAVAVGAVLVAGAASTLAAPGTHSSAGQNPPPSSPAATPVLPPSAPATALPPAPSASRTPSPAAKRPAVRWRGTLTVSGPDAHRDLDAVPPQTRPHGAGSDLTGDWLDTILKGDGRGVRLAPLEGPPSRKACRTAALTADTDELDIDTGDVVCVITSAGRLAALTATTATMTSTDPIMAFTVIVWSGCDRPAPACRDAE